MGMILVCRGSSGGFPRDTWGESGMAVLNVVVIDGGAAIPKDSRRGWGGGLGRGRGLNRRGRRLITFS